MIAKERENAKDLIGNFKKHATDFNVSKKWEYDNDLRFNCS